MTTTAKAKRMATSILNTGSYEVAPQRTLDHELPVEATHEFACCVVASNAARSDMLAMSAKAAGWGAIHCVAATDLDGTDFDCTAQEERLTIVDIAGSQPGDACRSLVQRLAKRRGALLLVCNNSGDAAEEIWARGLGVWFYLPGVPDDADLSSLCADALHITERSAPQTLELPAAPRPMRKAR